MPGEAIADHLALDLRALEHLAAAMLVEVAGAATDLGALGLAVVRPARDQDSSPQAIVRATVIISFATVSRSAGGASVVVGIGAGFGV